MIEDKLQTMVALTDDQGRSDGGRGGKGAPGARMRGDKMEKIRMLSVAGGAHIGCLRYSTFVVCGGEAHFGTRAPGA